MRGAITNLRQGNTALFAIGELSKRTGCNIETIRYYEKIGLLAAPVRTEGGHRMYGTAHLRRLSFIRRSRELGFALEEVRALLRLSDERDQPCADVKEVGVIHLADVRSKIADLRAMEAALEILVAKCADGKEPICPLIEALYDPSLRA
jgi:MerR family transcriptional regulator, mercuric resistance operon regulatory protein